MTTTSSTSQRSCSTSILPVPIVRTTLSHGAQSRSSRKPIFIPVLHSLSCSRPSLPRPIRDSMFRPGFAGATGSTAISAASGFPEKSARAVPDPTFSRALSIPELPSQEMSASLGQKPASCLKPCAVKENTNFPLTTRTSTSRTSSPSMIPSTLPRPTLMSKK